MRQLELITSHTPEIQKDCFLLSVANVKGILGFSVPSIILAALLRLVFTSDGVRVGFVSGVVRALMT